MIPQTVGAMTVSARVRAGGHKVSAHTYAPVTTPAYTHSIHFINQCPFPVWYGVENLAGNPNVQDPTSNPTPATYMLAAQALGQRPITKSITIPGTYLGEFFPRTGCTISGGFLKCKTGDCQSPASTGTCNGDGRSPFTRIEQIFFTSVQGAGYEGTYDISMLNGASIPVEMKGLGPANSNPVFADTPFYCTGTGAPIQPPQPQGSATLGICPWNFTVPTAQNMKPSLFNFVSYEAANNDDCTSIPCTGDDVCGMAYTNDDPSQNIVMSCGKLIGYWTIDQSCSNNANYASSGPTAFTNPKIALIVQLNIRRSLSRWHRLLWNLQL